MPELHDALRDLDRPKAPSDEFARDLEARWLAALTPPSTDALPEPGHEGQGTVDDAAVHLLHLDPGRPHGHRRRYLALAAAALLIVGLLVAALASLDHGRSVEPTTPPPPATTATPPTTPTPVTTATPETLLPSGDTLTHRQSFSTDVPYDSAPKRITKTSDGLWAPLGPTGRAVLLDPATLAVLREVDTGLNEVMDVQQVGDTVWFAGKGGIATMPPGADQPHLADGLIGDGEWGIAVAGPDVWVARFGDRQVTRVDPASGQRTTFDVPQPVSLLAASPDRLWIYAEPDGTQPAHLRGLDPARGAVVVTVDVVPPTSTTVVGNLLVTDTDAWIAGGDGGAWVTRVSNDGTVGATIKLPGDYADGMAIDGDGLWVAVRNGTFAYRINIADGSIVHEVSVPDRTADIATAGSILYTASYRDRAVQRIQLAP